MKEKLKMKIDLEASRQTGKPTLRGVRVNQGGESMLVTGQLSDGKGKIVSETPVPKPEPVIWPCVM